MASKPSGAAPPGATAKSMSGRLLNMKFMQRAAASTRPTSRNSTTATSHKSASSSAPQPAAVAASPSARTPTTVGATGGSNADPDAETPWALSYVPTPSMTRNATHGVRILSGFSAEDLAASSDDDDEDDDDAASPSAPKKAEDSEEDTGRMVFGTFRRDAEAAAKAAAKASAGYKSSSESESSGSEDSDEDEETAQRRRELKRQKKEKEEMRKLQKRGLERGGLSGVGAAGKIGFQGECYNCGEKGHMGRDCTRGKKRRKVEGR